MLRIGRFFRAFAVFCCAGAMAGCARAAPPILRARGRPHHLQRRAPRAAARHRVQRGRNTPARVLGPRPVPRDVARRPRRDARGETPLFSARSGSRDEDEPRRRSLRREAHRPRGILDWFRLLSHRHERPRRHCHAEVRLAGSLSEGGRSIRSRRRRRRRPRDPDPRDGGLVPREAQTPERLR